MKIKYRSFFIWQASQGKINRYVGMFVCGSAANFFSYIEGRWEGKNMP